MGAGMAAPAEQCSRGPSRVHWGLEEPCGGQCDWEMWEVWPEKGLGGR